MKKVLLVVGLRITLAFQGDTGILYSAFASTGNNHEMQNLIRILPSKLIKHVNCFSATRISELLHRVEELTGMAMLQAKSLPFGTFDDWDRILYGVQEVAEQEFDVRCTDANIDPNLCEALMTLSDVYMRRKLCPEVQDLEWRHIHCPSEPQTTPAPVTLPTPYHLRSRRPDRGPILGETPQRRVNSATSLHVSPEAWELSGRSDLITASKLQEFDAGILSSL